jgi:hypothetical protein
LRDKLDADPAVATQQKATPGQGGANNATPGDTSSISYWDLITQWCFFCGAVPYFVGSQLRIRPSKSLYDQRHYDTLPFDPAFPYPFGGNQPHKREIGPPLVKTPELPYGYRRLVFGKDILHLKFERKLGGVVVPPIHLASYNGEAPAKKAGLKTTRLIESWFPKDADPNLPQNQTGQLNPKNRPNKVGSSGKGGSSEPIYLTVPNIGNQLQLDAIAEALYHEIGRQEIGGSVSTKNLASFGGSNQDPDLLSLRPGDPIELKSVDSGMESYPPFRHELLDHTQRSAAEEIAELTKRLGSEALATSIVNSSRGTNGQLTRTFRVSTVKFDWNVDSGIGIDFDFQNFVEVRWSPPGGG